MHDTAADDSEGNKVFEYDCLIVSPEGYAIETLMAVSTSHAFTEAAYGFDGKCVAARRGEFAYENELPKS